MREENFGPIRQEPPKKRIPLLDELRALCILYMIFYHTGYDLAAIFGVNMPWFWGDVVSGIRYCVAGTFMLLAGISCHFSRSNWKRGLRVLGCALLITLITWLFMPGQVVTFGILHFMGVAMLLYALLSPILQGANPLGGLPACLILFFYTLHTASGYWDLFGFAAVPLPRALYAIPWLFPFGITAPGFLSADYYPLLPWFFLFLSGTFVGSILRRLTLPAWMYKTHLPPLAFIGRHSLAIYLVHQPLIFAILYLLFRFVI